jgi:hypothetical protein
MFTKTLPCRLTEQEIHDYSMSLARITAKLQMVREEKKAADADYNKEIKECALETQKLATTINKGYEDKPVEVEWTYDWTKNTKTMHRLDTGEVVMKDAPIEPHEKQGTLTAVEFGDRAASGEGKRPKKVYGIKKEPDKDKGE